MKDETLFSAVARASSEYRDRYVVEVLQRHLRDGERVFAVVGGTHIVMQSRHSRREAGPQLLRIVGQIGDLPVDVGDELIA